MIYMHYFGKGDNMKQSNLIMCEYNKGLLSGLSEAVLEFARFNEYGFQFLDDWYETENKYGLTIKLEYIENDIEYKQETDFEDWYEYLMFCYKMGETVIDKGLQLETKIKEIIKKYSLSIKLTEFEWDDYDYPCIYLFFEQRKK